MDLYSRRLIGGSLDSSMTEHLVTAALRMGLQRRDIEPGLIIHSDRGVQYRPQGFIDFMNRKGVKPSMSRKGDCWESVPHEVLWIYAPMKPFFSRFKVDPLNAEQYRSIESAKSGIFKYFEIFYSRLRRHSAIGYISPVEF